MNKYVLSLLTAITIGLHATAKVNNVITPSAIPALSTGKLPLPAPSAGTTFSSVVLSFIENKGQVTDQFRKPRTDIQYTLHGGNGLNIFIGNGAIHYQFSKAEKPSKESSKGLPCSMENNPGNYKLYRMDVELVGANKQAKLITDEPQSYIETYFNEITGPKGAMAHSCNRVTYKDVYPSVDWVLYTSNGELKHEFVVRPGGKVSDIKLKYGGATDLKVNNEGSLLAATPQGNITEKAPYSYELNGRKIKSSFRLDGNILTYQAEPFNSNGTLIIDPSIGWATFVGGANAWGMGNDPAGNVYLTGAAQLPGLATTGAYQTTIAGGDDAYLAKFSTCGVIIWATYFGGPAQEVSNSLTTDAAGNIYIAGGTRSSTGVTTPGAFRTTFVPMGIGGPLYHPFLAKFTNSGSLLWATYYGGDQTDMAYGVAVDKSGNPYIVGHTRSTYGIATPGADQTSVIGLIDAFLAKFNSAGNLLWGTYFGGSNYEEGTGVAVDKFDNPYIAGSTISMSGVSTPGAYQTAYTGSIGYYDAYLTKYNSAGVKQWATYYGGPGEERSKISVVVDTFDGVYFSGYTKSSTGIASPGAHQTSLAAGTNGSFIVKFNSSGARRWGTYFSGNSGSTCNGLVMTDSQYLYLSGNTYSTTGMVTPGAYKSTLTGSDAYIARFDTGGVLKMCTYVGGNNTDDAYYVSAHDSAVFICGTSNSTDFATPGCYNPTPPGAFLMRLDLGVSNTIMLPITGTASVCQGTSFTLSDGTPYGTWSSATPSVATVGSGTGIVTGVSGGTAVISYTITNFCGSKSVTTTVTIFPSASVITGNTKLCVGSVSMLSNVIGGGTWVSSNTTVATVGSGTGDVTGMGVGTAVITYVLGATCDAVTTVTVIPATSIGGASSVCTGSAIILSYSTSGGTWSSSNTTVASIGTGGTVIGLTQGTTTITYDILPGCFVTKSVTVNLTPAGITGPTSVCKSASIALSDATPGGSWSSASTAKATVDVLGTVTGTGAGTVNIIYASIEGCTVFKNITVLPNEPITGSLGICVGYATKLSNAVAGGTWSTSNTTISLVPSSGVILGLAVGTAEVTYSLLSGCSSTAIINISPAPSAITGAAHICGTSTVAYTNLLPGGVWSSSNTAVATIDPLGFATGVALGSTTIYYAMGSGCSVSKTVTVSPNAAPITLLNPTMCADGMPNYAFTSDTKGIWTSTLVTIDTLGKFVAYKAGPGIVTYTLPTGCYATASLSVNPLPSVITGPLSVCTGGVISLSDSVAGGLWSSYDTTILIDMYVGAVYGMYAGTAAITYTLPTGCVANRIITVYETPGPIMGTPNVCMAGGSTILTDATPTGVWSISPGGIASIGAGTGLVTGLLAGTATVTYTVGSGCITTTNLTVWPLPAVHSVTGGGSFCAGGAGLHVKLSGSATGTRYYLYYFASLVDSLNGSGGPLDFGARTASGIYTISAINMTTLCTSNMAGSVLINEDPIAVPAVSVTAIPSKDVCEGTSVTFIAAPTNGGSAPLYQWKVNGVNVGTSGSSYSFVPVSGDIVGVIMTSNATCAAPLTAFAFVTMTVVTPVVPDLTMTADPGVNLMPGQSVTFTATIGNLGLMPAPTYQWLKNGIIQPAETAPTYTTSTLATNDSIRCRVSSGGLCPRSATTKMVVSVYEITATGTAIVANQGSGLFVVPNPNNGTFMLTGSLGTTNDEGVAVEMTNMIGQAVYKGTINAKGGNIHEQIQVANTIANGMYLLNVRSGAMHKVFHIVVEQ